MEKNSIIDRGKVRCPIAAASGILADQWSVIILRDIVFFERRTFRTLLSHNNENIQSSTLAKRLKRLVDIGILSVTGDEFHSQRKIYRLTKAGIDLVPIIIEMAAWSSKHNLFNTHTIEFLKPLQENQNYALQHFMGKLSEKHDIQNR